MKTRKTISVEMVRNIANDMLRNSPDQDKDFREGINTMLERILMETGNYRGFAYLTWEDMLTSFNGTSVGIDNGSFENTDHTRVRYF